MLLKGNLYHTMVMARGVSSYRYRFRPESIFVTSNEFQMFG